MSNCEPRKSYYRRIIRIRAEDSPNVRLGMLQVAAGQQPTYETLVAGVLGYREYLKRRETWDKVRQTICLDGEFYKGAEALMYPPEWLNRAEQIANSLRGKPRIAKAIGIDPAEGGDKTSMAVVDELGLIELVSKKTPDTSVIVGEALAFMRRHGVPATAVWIDRGGGGVEHADQLRSQGHKVNTVAFGEAVFPEMYRGMTSMETKMHNREERYVYVNRRAQMYGVLREYLNPARPGNGFGLPIEYNELRRQLSPIPLMYDKEGRMRMLPKNRQSAGNSGEQTLTDLIGCSPDEADALVLAVYGLTHVREEVIIGAI